MTAEADQDEIAHDPTQNLTPFQPGHELGNGGKREYPLTEAVALQKLIMQFARSPDCKPLELAALARSWDVLENRKRVLRGIPEPGSLRPDGLPGKRAKRGQLIELAKGATFAEASETQPPKEQKAQ